MMRFGKGGCGRSAAVDSDGDVCLSDVCNSAGIADPMKRIAWIYQQDVAAFAPWLRERNGPFMATALCGASAKFNEDGSLHLWCDAVSAIEGAIGEATRVYEIHLTSDEAEQFATWLPTIGLP